jgi:hypothetical protein
MTYDDKGKYTPTVRESLDEIALAMHGIKNALDAIHMTLDDMLYEQCHPGSEAAAQRRNRRMYEAASKIKNTE